MLVLHIPFPVLNSPHSQGCLLAVLAHIVQVQGTSLMAGDLILIPGHDW